MIQDTKNTNKKKYIHTTENFFNLFKHLLAKLSIISMVNDKSIRINLPEHHIYIFTIYNSKWTIIFENKILKYSRK